MSGDTLARGAKSAIFGPARNISQERWNEIWEEQAKVIKDIKSASGKNEKLNGQSQSS